MTFPHAIESDVADYQGTAEAVAYEVVPPGVAVTNRIIRNDQKWGIQIDWEMHGPLSVWLDAEFRLRAYLESLGPGSDYELPVAGPLTVATLSVPNSPVGGVATRTYAAQIEVDPATTTVKPGTYMLITVIQVFERASGNPVPVAGFCEGPIIMVFEPGP